MQSPAFSETVLQWQDPPQLQKLIPVPSRLTRLTAVPHRHFVGSLASRPPHLQPSPHWHRIASLPSIFSTWPHLRSTPQAHLPGLVETVLHWHSGPQSQEYKTSCLSSPDEPTDQPVESNDIQRQNSKVFNICIIFNSLLDWIGHLWYSCKWKLTHPEVMTSIFT